VNLHKKQGVTLAPTTHQTPGEWGGPGLGGLSAEPRSGRVRPGRRDSRADAAELEDNLRPVECRSVHRSRSEDKSVAGPAHARTG
jgi:hypothetical protein